MNIDELLRAIFNYGFPTVALIFVAVGAWKLINRIISYNKEREDKLMMVIQSDLANFNKSIAVALDHLTEFKRSSDEAHRYQRDEHKEILEKINHLK